MTTILLLSLTLAGMFLCWMITLYRLEYWRNRALYAEALEEARIIARHDRYAIQRAQTDQ